MKSLQNREGLTKHIFMQRIYHFLSSVYFAILLIALVAFFVIAGTFIESWTQSHQYASRLTYGNPVFLLLLMGFFINILFSTTRRWPFKIKHIPFLITHLGLLMILAGAIIKNCCGLQGSMSLFEGSASQKIFELGSFAVLVEGHQKDAPTQYYSLKRSFSGEFKQLIANTPEGLHLYLTDYTPHSTENLATWIKGDFAFVQGINPLPVHQVENPTFISSQFLSGRMRFHKDSSPWNLFALRSSHPAEIAKLLYQQSTQIKIKDALTDHTLIERPLEGALNSILKINPKIDVKVLLDFQFSSIEGVENSKIQLSFEDTEKNKNILEVSINGSQALLNRNHSTPYLGRLPYSIDLICQPLLAFIQDDQNDLYLIAVNSHGEIWSKVFRNDNIDSIIAYDDGYKGYTIQTKLPLNLLEISREEREIALIRQIEWQLNLETAVQDDKVMQDFELESLPLGGDHSQKVKVPPNGSDYGSKDCVTLSSSTAVSRLKQTLEKKSELSQPLQVLQRTCSKSDADFAATLVAFLTHWDKTHSWIYPANIPLPISIAPIFENLEWKEVPLKEKQACHWLVSLFETIDPELQKGHDFIEILQKKRWPLLALLKAQRKQSGPCDHEETTLLMTLMSQQVFAAANMHQEALNLETPSAEENAALFSAYLRAYGIHLSAIIPPSQDIHTVCQNYLETSNRPYPEPILLETQVVPFYQAIPPQNKLEENFPKITLLAKKDKISQSISLAYDRFATGLKWPILNGSYLLRFQPLFKEIPYRIRLRNARQINYPNSNQPYSFESDLIITDRRNGSSVEKTISMNHVHETWDGYRFYLSSITPPTENGAKQIQIVVNYDPAKYWLTYPGALILTLGIVLLFTMRPYK